MAHEMPPLLNVKVAGRRRGGSRPGFAHTTQQDRDSRYNGAEGYTRWYEDAWCTSQELPIINNMKYVVVETLRGDLCSGGWS